MKYQKLIIYTDGGARGNPGPAGVGVVIYDVNKKVVQELGEYIGEQTNNQAEYKALILGLVRAKTLGAEEVECYLDSELVVKQMQGKYRVKNAKLKPLYSEVTELVKYFKRISYAHVVREKNEEADRLVNEAIDGELG
ncbi:MAG: ribonuclease HI family protein [Candidatus Marinimicrobia bacterium]|nr:ribonuclease HI family protein [Candidatus Neomarinimicrobiota bacterium]